MSEVINIFTDASVKHFKDLGITVGCPGYNVFFGNTMFRPTYYYYILDSTNNESEITAILEALKYVYENPTYFVNAERINIFSDSKISIYGLREWYKKWITNIRNGEMYSSSGKPVANQRFFLFTMAYTTLINKPVNFYHVNGHIDLWNKNSINKFINTFMRENQCNRDLSRYEIDFLVDGNNLVDEITGAVDSYERENLVHGYLKQNNTISIVDIPKIVQSIDFNLYNKLIRDYRNIQLF